MRKIPEKGKNRMDDCLFCKIAAGTIPANLAFENDELMAFHDIRPQAPTHILIIPSGIFQPLMSVILMMMGF